MIFYLFFKNFFYDVPILCVILGIRLRVEKKITLLFLSL